MYKLLIIDDDPIICKALAHTFALEKYEVQISHTADDGVKTCIKELPDLILLDVNLPDGSGLDLCRRMKENPRINHIPIIILTGRATEVEDKTKGLKSGAEDYVLKPFIAEEIIARVAGIIKRSFNPKGNQSV